MATEAGPSIPNRQGLSDRDIERVEAIARIEKLDLEHTKLRLEQRALERQISRQGYVLEWLKALAVPAALLGVIASFVVGTGQLEQLAEGQAAERFERAITRLSSVRPNDRIAGISSLRIFLSGSDVGRQAAVLDFLINAAAVETDPFVAGAVIDVFSGAEIRRLKKSILDNALRTAVERSRNLTSLMTESGWLKIQAAKEDIIQGEKKMNSNNIDMLSRQVTKNLLLKYAKQSRWPFDHIQKDDLIRLYNIRDVINALLLSGAMISQFQGIFCEHCDFRNVKEINGVNFNGSYLTGSTFASTHLRNVRFFWADLAGTSFVDAKLEGVHIQMPPSPEGYLRMIKDGQALPQFNCASIGDVTFNGPMIFIDLTVISKDDANAIAYISDLSKAKFTSSGIFRPTILFRLNVPENMIQETAHQISSSSIIEDRSEEYDLYIDGDIISFVQVIDPYYYERYNIAEWASALFQDLIKQIPENNLPSGVPAKFKPHNVAVPVQDKYCFAHAKESKIRSNSNFKRLEFSVKDFRLPQLGVSSGRHN
jgi:uncharacterized protein YjbI with pentapeptide repeats